MLCAYTLAAVHLILYALNLGLVNSFTRCYCICLDQNLLPGWMSLNSGATETQELNQIQTTFLSGGSISGEKGKEY